MQCVQRDQRVICHYTATILPTLSSTTYHALRCENCIGCSPVSNSCLLSAYSCDYCTVNVHSFIHSIICSFIHSVVHSCIHSPIHAFMHPPSIHLSRYPPIHPSIHPLAELFIHPFMHTERCRCLSLSMHNPEAISLLHIVQAYSVRSLLMAAYHASCRSTDLSAAVVHKPNHKLACMDLVGMHKRSCSRETRLVLHVPSSHHELENVLINVIIIHC